MIAKSKNADTPPGDRIDRLIQERVDGDIVVTFSDVHLPRGVGTAIANAYEGELDVKFTDDAGIVGAVWRR